jgi:hypothetical protein
MQEARGGEVAHRTAIIFALPLHACLALYVEQMNERELVCAWCMENLRGNKLVPGTNKQFLGLVFTALRLLPPTKSVTQAKRQHVLFGRCLLANIAFQAVHIHFNRIAYWRHKVSALCVPFFAILSPTWPL